MICLIWATQLLVQTSPIMHTDKEEMTKSSEEMQNIRGFSEATATTRYGLSTQVSSRPSILPTLSQPMRGVAMATISYMGLLQFPQTGKATRGCTERMATTSFILETLLQRTEAMKSTVMEAMISCTARAEPTTVCMESRVTTSSSVAQAVTRSGETITTLRSNGPLIRVKASLSTHQS